MNKLSNLMLSLMFLLPCLSVTPAQAQPVAGPIEEMDQGSCWIQKHELDGKLMGYQVASFGTGTAFRLFRDDFTAGSLRAWVQIQLKTRFTTLPALRFEVGLYCYSSGHYVTVQVDRPGAQPLCLQAKGVNGTNELELLALRPEQTFITGATCAGIEERTIGLSLKNSTAESVERIRAAIANNRTLADIVASVEYQPGLPFALAKLKESYAFREVEAQNQLVNSPLVMEEISSAWLNPIGYITGEERVLFDGMTEAY